ncbi:MAG: dCTP deaminase [Nanoarchaeota archaeon]|nr:dCTP deaminase [Nanoarchaeota archaeon]
MILTKEAIKKAVKDKKIKINPYKAHNLNGASLDITLSDDFWFYTRSQTIKLSEHTDFNKYTKHKKRNSIRLEPGEFVLGMSEEKITMPDNICALLSGRSRFARMGIVVHATAFLMHPGVSNHQMFEIKNLSNNTLVLEKGLKIAQVIFVKTEGKEKYKGRYKNQ